MAQLEERLEELQQEQNNMMRAYQSGDKATHDFADD